LKCGWWQAAIRWLFLLDSSDAVTVAFAGLFTLICVSVWAGEMQEYFDNRDPLNWAGNNIGELSWAFGFAVTDCILTFISLGLLIAGLAGGEPMY